MKIKILIFQYIDNWEKSKDIWEKLFALIKKNTCASQLLNDSKPKTRVYAFKLAISEFFLNSFSCKFSIQNNEKK